MGVYSYNDLRPHIGHKIACVCYGKQNKDPENVSVECETCNTVLMDYNKGADDKDTSNIQHPARQLAIGILEAIADKLEKPKIFDYDLEDMLTTMINEWDKTE